MLQPPPSAEALDTAMHGAEMIKPNTEHFFSRVQRFLVQLVLLFLLLTSIGRVVFVELNSFAWRTPDPGRLVRDKSGR